jgi:hypothetical protein
MLCSLSSLPSLAGVAGCSTALPLQTVKQVHGIVRGLGGEDWIYVDLSISILIKNTPFI